MTLELVDPPGEAVVLCCHPAQNFGFANHEDPAENPLVRNDGG